MQAVCGAAGRMSPGKAIWSRPMDAAKWALFRWQDVVGQAHPHDGPMGPYILTYIHI